MRRSAGMALILLFAFASFGRASKVHVDYDPQADFGSYRTFAWADTAKGFNLADVNELLHLRVKNYIEARMTQAGFLMVDKNPDLWVAYYTTSKEQTKINFVTMGYTFPTAWSWDPYWLGAWGYGGSAATSGQVAVYTKGTLIIDIVDARTKQLIWRGTLLDSVPETNVVDKLSKKIYKGIDKIIRKWRKMQKEQLAQEAKGS